MIAEGSLLFSFVIGFLTLSAADVQEPQGPIFVNPTQSEVILKYKQNYTLICRGPNHVDIKQQHVSEENTVNFPTILRHGQNESQHWAKLELYNVDRYTVGYYACFDDTVDSNSPGFLQDIAEELNNTDHISYIYVYVDGDPTLFAPLSAFIQTNGNLKLFIPCKPTSPDVKVELEPDSGYIEHGLYLFHPKLGFIIDIDAVFTSDDIITILSCHFEKENKTESQDVVVEKNLNATPLNPKIVETQKYFLKGETFSLNCTSTLPDRGGASLNWTIPGGSTIDLERMKEDSNENNTVGPTLYKNITVMNACREDDGNYTCTASQVNKIGREKVFVTKKYLDKPLLKLSSPNAQKDIEVDTAKMKILSIPITIEAYPHPNYTVYRNGNVLNIDGKKYAMTSDSESNNPKMYKFTLKYLMALDTGKYSIWFFNGESLMVDQYVKVKAKPEVKIINTEKIYDIGSYATLSCEAVGYPRPEIQWTFIEEDGTRTELLKSQFKIDTEKYEARKVSKLTLPVKISGEIECLATSDLGINTTTRVFKVYEIPNGFGIMNSSNTWFVEKSTVILQCFASKNDFIKEISWYYRSFQNEIKSDFTETNYSYVAELRIDQVTVNQEGTYYCKATRQNGTEAIEKINITVAKIEGPTIIGPEEESEIKEQADEVRMSCVTFAVPPPTITWYKDEMPLKEDRIIKVKYARVNRTLLSSTVTIYSMQSNYAGKYECEVSSEDNLKTKTFNISLKEPKSYKVVYLSVAGSIFFLLILLVAYLTWKIRKEKQFRRELKRAGLLYFKEGHTKSLNPELGIDEQAELLPYNDKFEFPVEKLTLGKQLGAGAFGVVYKAEARGIINAEESTTVAVKMVKKTADNMYIKALASELKIMVHLGKHVNIVNLLGACTKNVEKRELIVIVEYCKFGNIHNYLIKHREVFIDQLNDNPEKTLGRVNRGYTCSTANSAPGSEYFGSNHTQNTDNTFLNTATTNRSGRTVSESGYISQSEWRSNYEGDYSFDGRSPRPLCTRDLLAWAFQIARGMEYLASRKILHGDLAARNILLAEDNVVKICDFGLARSIYNNAEYKKTENSLLPIKWLAVECMTDRIFSTQSDVWSFGIVLWELFSLAKTPYPNIEPQNLLQYLQEGHRLSQPSHADDRLYDMMRSCWHPKPSMRPSFTLLQEALGCLLEDNVRNHYTGLNDIYLDLNAKKEGEDYLAMIAAPDYNNMVTPSPHHYVNQANNFFPPSPSQLQHDDEGYLQMSPASRQTIYKARPQGTKFDFDAQKLNPRGVELNSYGSESTPMLTLNNMPRSGSESDQEGNVSPYMNMCAKIVEEPSDEVFDSKENNVKNIQPNQVTNPSYIMIPAHAQFTVDDEKKPQISNGNYLNVPNAGLVK